MTAATARILIVDPDLDFRLRLSSTLQRLGVTVTAVVSAAEAEITDVPQLVVVAAGESDQLLQSADEFAAGVMILNDGETAPVMVKPLFRCLIRRSIDTELLGPILADTAREMAVHGTSAAEVVSIRSTR